jgi:aminoglycoside 6-adenylyltransferase
MRLAEQTCEHWTERFVRWAEAQPDIRTVIVVGSRARADRPADQWSDLDLILVTRDPKRYLLRTDWLANLGRHWCTFVERTATGDEVERRVLFEGGLDVDFLLVPLDRAQQLVRETPLADIISRGARVLVDKDGTGPQLTARIGEAAPRHPPTQQQFEEAIHDFWYHAVWTSKKLRRGELWTSKRCCDSYMKQLLLRMIEWHACASHGWDYDTWHGGRFLEQWTAPGVLRALRDAFAHYDEHDVRRALLATMCLYRRLAVETAGRLGYAYPAAADGHVTGWVRACLSEKNEGNLPDDTHGTSAEFLQEI